MQGLAILARLCADSSPPVRRFVNQQDDVRGLWRQDTKAPRDTAEDSPRRIRGHIELAHRPAIEIHHEGPAARLAVALDRPGQTIVDLRTDDDIRLNPIARVERCRQIGIPQAQ